MIQVYFATCRSGWRSSSRRREAAQALSRSDTFAVGLIKEGLRVPLVPLPRLGLQLAAFHLDHRRRVGQAY